jgi:DNA-binding XRE family transcriptional regulator
MMNGRGGVPPTGERVLIARRSAANLSKMSAPSKRRLLIAPAQCRAARALLSWTLDEAAAASGLSRVTILHFEQGRRKKMFYATEAALVRAFETAGIVLLDDPDGMGVKLLTLSAN